MSPGHPLDRPAWSALTTRWAPLALGDARTALRLDPDYGPFAATVDWSSQSLTALAAFVPGDKEVWVVETEAIPPPPGVLASEPHAVDQMVAERLASSRVVFEISPLTEEDATQMQALAHLTKPGPFEAKTHRLGGFMGVKLEGELVAMAGERMKLEGFTEVSGVCTHPNHRGKGYAAGLMLHVAGLIQARGETPFLHAYAANTGAIRLYEVLGFKRRCTMAMTVLTRP